jgi:LDH2 family malate/lactate/ureidoglycolate dehydrogenase
VEVAGQLVSSGLRGTDTHGTVLVRRYIEGIGSGAINKAPKIRVLRQGSSTALIDGDFGAGQFVATKATQMAIGKARKTGIGAVSAIKVQHLGTLAYYAAIISSRRMAGILFTNSSAWGAPLGRAKRTFGTNPLCFVFPHKEFPLILDMATTAAAGMKIFLMSKEGATLPEGWAIDKEGRPTTDPNEAQEGILLPFGGHKGSGLMLMTELYSALLSGGMVSYKISPPDAQGGFYVQALDIGRFRKYRTYARDLDRLVETVKSGPLTEGYKEVLLPGELEARTAAERTRAGIPVDMETWDYFEILSSKYHISLPRLI